MPVPTLAPPGRPPGIRSNPSAAHLPAAREHERTRHRHLLELAFISSLQPRGAD